MKKLVALFAAVAFAAGTVGFAVAQDKKADEKKAEKPAAASAEKGDAKSAKKMAARSASGKVKSASADSIVVAGKAKGKDTEWTFAIDPKTKIKKGGKDVTAADVKEGDSVQVKYVDHEGKAVAQAVTVKAAPAPKKEKAAAAPAEKPAEKK